LPTGGAVTVATAPKPARDSEAFHGYLIRTHPWNGETWIEKDGYRIAGAADVADAKRIIVEELGA
jgi:hypothetical protein